MSIIVTEKLYKTLVEMWWLSGGDVVAHWWRCGGSFEKMWWLIGSAPDFKGRGPEFESGISHNDHNAG